MGAFDVLIKARIKEQAIIKLALYNNRVLELESFGDELIADLEKIEGQLGPNILDIASRLKGVHIAIKTVILEQKTADNLNTGRINI